MVTCLNPNYMNDQWMVYSKVVFILQQGITYKT